MYRRKVTVELARLMRLCAMLALMVCAVPAQAQNRDGGSHGLMWHRTGLPAVFPLQVKTHPGQDYYVLLTDAENDGAALAAYIEGGRFFQVLVPPGTFRVRFAIGKNWQGEEELFGPGDLTEVVELAEPLTFAVRNYNTKGGHVVDLTVLPPRDETKAEVRDTAVCQRLTLGTSERAWQGEGARRTPDRRRDDPLYLPDPLTRLDDNGVELAQPDQPEEEEKRPMKKVVRPAQC